ncbi:thiol reductase thioredoxin [Sediminibacillus dalangtanensis]|uniref:Thiol reductase thioredoxin n=1 Tax=Sediminibacillus dalangtanensis TaxID=2729421 RepID=A0ABX7VP14_9BACI|nr:thioredoxin family protein [Sediminibacillus dalangtanensis]QTM98632.1 thiol reductase thioredoxin [Sediminibacillus dalangtanensis]
MNKKMWIILGVIVVLIGALIFVVNYQNNQKMADNPYGKENLRQSTIDQLDNELYQNQILPGELEEKLDNQEDVTVYFYSPECVHCQNTTPVIVPMTEEYGIDLKKLNILEFQEPWETYNIEGTPTVIHFENGEEAARISGEQSVTTWDGFFQENVLDEEEQ